MKSPQRIFSRKSAPSSQRGEKGAAPRTRIAQRRPMLLVHLDAWRDAAVEVKAAWRRWRVASGGTRANAALAFFAALEREEKAADVYRLASES